jgi:hypothetical protein
MKDYWLENGDILVHKGQGVPIGLLVIVAIGGFVFLAVAPWPVGVLGSLLLWFVFALELLSFVQSEEFDRRRKVMRRRGVLGLGWIEPLDRFACVDVVRGYSKRGLPQIRVNLERVGLEKGAGPECLVALYPFPSEADENEAREWGDRLARFLDLPLRLQL